MPNTIDSLFGRPAFVLGNSPRLPVAQLKCLSGQFTIGVNRILRTGFTPTVILWVDDTVYADDGKQIDESEALLICDGSVARHELHHGLKTWVGDAALVHESTPTELCINGNTGCCAARWALVLGCRPVYLVGMEAAYKGALTDFWGQNQYHHGGSTLNVMRKELVRLQRDFPGMVLAISDDGLLQEIAAELPDMNQDQLRCAILEHVCAAQPSNC
ncbi:MAG: hypothetical protein HQ546_01790 [Planctomycetes bacterium]|nr:hypothetical protein [Planctomycetota bacterium]